MESNPRATLRAHGVRPLGLPRPLTVWTNARGEPVEVVLGTEVLGTEAPSAEAGDGRPEGRRGERQVERHGRHGDRHAVEHIDEVWRVAEAWWREAPIRRTYFRVLIEGGRPLTLFRDDDAIESRGVDGGTGESSTAWYEQRY